MFRRPRSRLARLPDRRERARPDASGPRHAVRGASGAIQHRGCRRRRARRRVRHAALRGRRGRRPRARGRHPRRLPTASSRRVGAQRARLLRGQGVPLHRGRALDDRGGPPHRRLQRRRARRRARRRRRPARDSASTATTSPSPRSTARSRPASARSSSTASSRSTASPTPPTRHGRVQPVRLRVNSGVHASTHEYLATAREDQKFGIALADAADAVAAHPRARRRCGSSACTRTSARRSSSRTASPRPRAGCSTLHAQLLAGGAGARAQPRRRLRHRLHERRRRRADRRRSPPSSRDVVAAECARLGIPVPVVAVEPGRAIIGPAGVTLYTVGTVKDVRRSTTLGRPPLRQRRRRHERQHPPRPLRRRLLRAHREPRLGCRPRPRARRRQALRVRRHRRARRLPARRRRAPATCSRCRRPAPTAGRSRATTTTSGARPSSPCATGAPRARARARPRTTSSPATPGILPPRIRSHLAPSPSDTMIEYRNLRIALLGAGSVGAQVARCCSSTATSSPRASARASSSSGVAVRDLDAPRTAELPRELLHHRRASRSSSAPTSSSS